MFILFVNLVTKLQKRREVRNIRRILNHILICLLQDYPPQSHLSWLSYRNNNYSLLARALGEDEQLATQWLENLINSLPRLKIVPVQITMIASALFITSPGQPWSDQSLRALQSISKADPQQVQVDKSDYSLEFCIIPFNTNSLTGCSFQFFICSLAVAC